MWWLYLTVMAEEGKASVVRLLSAGEVVRCKVVLRPENREVPVVLRGPFLLEE